MKQKTISGFLLESSGLCVMSFSGLAWRALSAVRVHASSRGAPSWQQADGDWP